MSYPNGFRLKVFVFILDDNLKVGTNAVIDSRERLLNKCRPDTVIRGYKTNCGREWIRQMIDKGFYGDRPIDWLRNVNRAIFDKDVSLDTILSFRKVLREEMERTAPIAPDTFSPLAGDSTKN